MRTAGTLFAEIGRGFDLNIALTLVF